MTHVLVVGGTSGMGLGLARCYAASGAKVTVIGRDAGRLPEAAQREGIRALQADVIDAANIQARVRQAGKDGFDLLIYSAGFYATEAEVRAEPKKGERIDQTNVDGVGHVVEAALPLMRHGGRIALIASIAGLLRPDPWTTRYATSKRRAMSRFASYREKAAAHNVGLTLLVPGYVDTQELRRLNGGQRPDKPFLQQEAHAVAVMKKALDRQQTRCVFPWQLHALVRLYNLLPAPLRALRQ